MNRGAVIGCGRARQGKVGWAQGHAHAAGMLAAFPELELHGVDVDEENLRAFGEAFGVPKERLHLSTEALYGSVTPDVVGIATWPSLHAPQVHEAAWKGVKGILCEKPMAIDGGEIDRMLEVCQKRGAKLAIAHQRRHEPRFKLAKKLIEEGRFGEKVVLHARVGDDWDMLSWTVHWFDMANHFFGGPPEWVLAGVDFLGEERYRHAVESASVVFAQYAGSRQAIFTTGPAPLADFGIMIEGERAFGRFRKEGLLLAGAEGSEIVPVAAGGQEEAYADVYREIGHAVVSGKPMLCGAEQCAWATRMAFAAHESAVFRRKVKLPSMVKYPPLEVLRRQTQSERLSGRRMVALTDRHHADPVTGESTRDGLAKALRALGHDVALVPLEEREAAAEDLDKADTLVICHTVFQSSEETRKVVGDWIRGGRPTLIVHCGIGAWPDWQEFREWSGFYWVWDPKLVPADAGKKGSGHPFVECEIDVLDTRLKTGWQKAWLPTDEVYVDLAEGDAVELLAATTVDGKRQPIAWRNKKRPNVAVWLPGHRPDVWELAAMRDGLRAVCELVQSKR